MAEEKILTLHPEGKQGVNISRTKYDAVRGAILTALADQGGMLAFEQLPDAVTARLPVDWEGSVGWYTTTVKLDLEARGAIERVPGQSPQLVRLPAADRQT